MLGSIADTSPDPEEPGSRLERNSFAGSRGCGDRAGGIHRFWGIVWVVEDPVGCHSEVEKCV